MDKNHYISRKKFKELLDSSDPAKLEQLDAFEEEALKGWKNSGVSFNAMHKLDRKFGRYNFPWKSVTAIGTVLVITGLIFFIQSNDSLRVQETTPKRAKPVIVKFEKPDIHIPEAIDTLTDIPHKEQIRTKEVIQTQQELTKSKEEGKLKPENAVIPFPDFTLDPLPPMVEQKPKTVNQQRQAKEVYLKSLKAIDYSAYRNKPIVPIDQIILSGVPANLESENDLVQEEPEIKKIEIPYMDYLEKTLQYVYKERWKIALSRFQEILKNYPDDVNAHFYAGWCSYNLGQYDEACTHFSACLQLEFSNFNEEAEWYLAQSRLNNHEKGLAKELFVKIKNQKGFYAKQAENMLKNWK